MALLWSEDESTRILFWPGNARKDRAGTEILVTQFQLVSLSAAQLHRELHRRRLQTEILEIRIRLVEGAIGLGLSDIAGKAVGRRLVGFGGQRLSQLPVVLVFLQHKLTVGILDSDLCNVFLFKLENLLFFLDGLFSLLFSLDLVEIDPGEQSRENGHNDCEILPFHRLPSP